MTFIVIRIRFIVTPTLFDIHPTFWNDDFGLDGRTWQFKSSATLHAALAAILKPSRVFGRSSNRFFECGIEERLVARPGTFSTRLEFFNYFVVQHDGDAGLA